MREILIGRTVAPSRVWHVDRVPAADVDRNPIIGHSVSRAGGRLTHQKAMTDVQGPVSYGYRRRWSAGEVEWGRARAAGRSDTLTPITMRSKRPGCERSGLASRWTGIIRDVVAVVVVVDVDVVRKGNAIHDSAGCGITSQALDRKSDRDDRHTVAS